MHTILVVVHLFLAIGIIGLVLMQHGKGADAGAAFGSGASGTVFGARGSANFLSRSTAILASLFFVTSLALAWFAMKSTDRGGLMDKVEAPPPVAVEKPNTAVPAIPGIGAPEAKPAAVPAIPEGKAPEAKSGADSPTPVTKVEEVPAVPVEVPAKAPEVASAANVTEATPASVPQAGMQGESQTSVPPAQAEPSQAPAQAQATDQGTTGQVPPKTE